MILDDFVRSLRQHRDVRANPVSGAFARVDVIMTSEGEEVGVTTVESLPGNGRIAMLSGGQVADGLRGRGFGGRMHMLVLEGLRAAGFQAAICTVHKGNEPQERILRRHSWFCVAPATETADLWWIPLD